MKIKGTEGLTLADINDELQSGAKFVIYQYCISIVLMTFKRGSGIYFIRSGESSVIRGIGWSMVSLLLGWWGIPWGPIYTVSTVVNNFGGGKDVTDEVLNAANAHFVTAAGKVA